MRRDRTGLIHKDNVTLAVLNCFIIYTKEILMLSEKFIFNEGFYILFISISCLPSFSII